MGTAVWFVAVACFGVSAAGKPLETAHLAVLLASLTLVPGAVRHGVPLGGAAATTWGVLVTAARGVDDGARAAAVVEKQRRLSARRIRRRLREFEHADLVWVLGGWGASLGAWCGAMVIPLDWDRPWQKWPVPCAPAPSPGSGSGSSPRRRPYRLRASSGDADGEKTAEDRVNARCLCIIASARGRCRTCALECRVT